MNSPDPRVAVVIITHNRINDLMRTLGHMHRLPECPVLVVVDNASTDGTAPRIARQYPGVTLVALDRNMGAAARNVGVAKVRTPYVAFCDDDSWWDDGALGMAADILDRYAQVAALCGRVLLGDAQQEDPVCRLFAASPLPSAGLPGRALLGFVACAAVFRRQAYLQAGGYEEKFLVGGEEELLTLDLAATGWSVAYVPQLTVYHHPSPFRDNVVRQRIVTRNAFWVAWLRLPAAVAWRETLRICRSAPDRAVLQAALLDALRELPWIWRKRKVLPPRVQLLRRQLQP